MKKIYLFLVVIGLFFSSCEKDDICDANTPTTPRLVISFYDYSNPSVLKSVNNLKVIGLGMTEGIVFNAATTLDLKYLTNASSISIPLKTTEDSTTYSLILNSGLTGFENTDNIRFDYTRNEVYVSRACGFKTLFTLNPQNPITHSDAALPDQKWIKYISVEKSNIDNEYETHIKIFF